MTYQAQQSWFPGQNLDVEFAAIEATTDEIRTNLALIQRDDGALANESVDVAQLTPTLAAAVGDVAAVSVVNGYVAAAAASATTASTQATNAAASATTASTQATNAATSATAAATSATNAATTLASALTKSDNLASLASAATARTNLGVAIGTNVQAFDADLATLAALGNWKIAYTDGSSVQTALALGADKTILAGNGVGAAPSFRTAANLSLLEKDVSSTLTAGFDTTSFSAGTKSSGTFTPAPASGNIQHYTNGGAHTLAPPATTCTMVIECTNATAGAITTSGFTIVDGDVYSSSGTKKHIFYVTKTNSFSRLTVTYVTGT